MDIEHTKLHYLNLRCWHGRAERDCLPGKIDVRDQRHADTIVPSVCDTTEELAFEACGQHPYTVGVGRSSAAMASIPSAVCSAY